VESLSDNVRITQFADLPYATKRLQSDKWYWLTPMGYTGYLVFMPKVPVVWIDEQFKVSYRIPMRVNAAIYEKKSVFIASLLQVDGLLRLEDAWVVAGRSLFDDPFSKRWLDVLDFYSDSYRADSQLQGGLTIEVAKFDSLHSALEWKGTPTTMIAQGETAPRRLRVQLIAKTPPVAVAATATATAAATATVAVSTQPKAKATATATQPKAKAVAVAVAVAAKAKTQAHSTKPPFTQTKAIAVAHPDFPDTYDIFIDGVKKGYAAVQDIEVSHKLRSKKLELSAKGGDLCVNVEWNEEFSMYEILSLPSTE